LSGVVLFFSFTGIKFTTMKRISLLSVVYWFSLSLAAQNVGINNPTPAEKLDVNGNINVTGTIKANGVDGTANQVLMKNSSGNLAWGDICNYKNAVTLTSTSGGTWTVPANVTSILVEVWGAGGGGNILAGGGGGGYCRAHFTVAPGATVSYNAGTGGTGSISSSAVNGSSSQCTVNGIPVTGYGGGGGLIFFCI
jgi:hypothetical protein